MVIKLAIYCFNCDEEITKEINHISENKNNITINISEFEQTDWVCPKCNHITCIGDIDTIDSEDL